MNVRLIQNTFFLIIGTFSFANLTSCGADIPARVVEAEANIPDIIDFNYHVRPILSDRCYTCHGPDEQAREADLRLDTEEGALKSLLESGHKPIVPGNLGKSVVFERIISEDPDIVMPPPSSNLSLNAEEIAILSRWIEQGAEWKSHWSFIPPQKPKVPSPTPSLQSWPQNGVDNFVLEAMQRKGLTPADKASKAKLIRRAAFDLTGLPPTLEEIDEFLADTSVNAFEKVVDDLLSSPHYGEHMAIDWLDAARYSDTHGYQDDIFRRVWPWRDWVVEAFNDNLPYDEFVRWQIAGDLLPTPSLEQKLATTFNRNHMTNVEGGIIEEEFRVEYVADRANTTAKAFLGLTMECARCHDHKYDPISQKEYYQFYSFFNSVDDVGKPPRDNGEAPEPALLLTTPEQEAQIAFLKNQISKEEGKLENWEKGLQEEFENWLKTDRTSHRVSLKPDHHFRMEKAVNKEVKHMDEVEGVKGKAILFDGERSVSFAKVPKWERSDAFSMSFWLKVPQIKDYAGILAKSTEYYGGNRGYEILLQGNQLQLRLSHQWPQNSITLLTQKEVPVDQWTHIAFTYDGSSRAKGLRIFIDGELDESIVERDHLYRTIIPSYGNLSWERSLRIGIRDNEKGFENGALDELMLFSRELSEIEITELSGKTYDQLFTKSELSQQEQQRLFEYYRLNHQTFTEERDQLMAYRQALNDTLSRIPQTMIMQDRAQPRATFVLNRGQYDAPTEEEVFPATPSYIGNASTETHKNRFGLAQWLTDPAHPLTARVMVNRYWMKYFGQGIVSTPDDFGSQGSLPTHPELLDWLAVRFVESGWDVKGMQKLIMMSATYQQSTVSTPEKLEIDPANTWLSRGASYRLKAETVRDQALAVSGLLDQTLGGPPVKPYQPEGLWKEKASIIGEQTYIPGTGQDLYRRSMYTYWRRTIPPPSMLIFDANTRSLCEVKRHRTNTPLQALVLLNDPQYLEASRVLAERMIQEGGQKTEERITFAFRLLTSRFPTEREVSLMQKLLVDEEGRFKRNPQDAQDILNVGAYAYDMDLDMTELAAYTIVANTMMNLDEVNIKR